MLKPRMSRLLFTGFAALALAACSGANDQTSQPETTTASATKTDAKVRAQFGDPARMIAHFDQNKDGVLQISELPPRMQKWMAKADTDGDGNLSAAELQAHADAMKKEHFARMDKNQDGALTKDEVGDKRWSHVSVADADNNGSITQAELDQAFASGKIQPMRQGWGKHDGKADGRRDGMREHHGQGGRLFKMDSDKDGALTQAEVGDEIWTHIGVADANKDGKVTKDELKAAHENGTLVPMRPMMQPEEPSAPQAPAEAPPAQ